MHLCLTATHTHIFHRSLRVLSFAIQSKNNCIKLCATEREISFLVATFALSTMSSVVGGIACYICFPFPLPALPLLSITLGSAARAAIALPLPTPSYYSKWRRATTDAASFARCMQMTIVVLRSLCVWQSVCVYDTLCVCVAVCVCVCIHDVLMNFMAGFINIVFFEPGYLVCALFVSAWLSAMSWFWVP